MQLFVIPGMSDQPWQINEHRFYGYVAGLWKKVIIRRINDTKSSMNKKWIVDNADTGDLISGYIGLRGRYLYCDGNSESCIKIVNLIRDNLIESDKHSVLIKFIGGNDKLPLPVNRYTTEYEIKQYVDSLQQ